jgi:uncharacterized protein (UPF0332 family)
MNPRQFLDLAEEWATGLTEGEWRSAVSRAYYAAFHVACILLRQCSFAVPQADRAHSYLWLRLANCGHPDLAQAGEDLNELRRNRNLADYELNRPMEQRQAMGQVLVADTIIQQLDTAVSLPHVLTAITATMRTYERDVLGDVTWHP